MGNAFIFPRVAGRGRVAEVPSEGRCILDRGDARHRQGAGQKRGSEMRQCDRGADWAVRVRR